MMDIFSPTKDTVMSKTTPLPSYHSAITPSSNLAKVQLSSSLDTKNATFTKKPSTDALKPSSVLSSDNSVFSPVQTDSVPSKNLANIMPRLSVPEQPNPSKKLSSDFHISQEPSSLSFLKPSSFGNEATDLNRELNDIVTNLNYDAQPQFKPTFVDLPKQKKQSEFEKVTQRNIFSEVPSITQFSQPPSPIRPSIDISSAMKYQPSQQEPIDSMAIEPETQPSSYEQPPMQQHIAQQQQPPIANFQAEWLKNIVEEGMNNLKQYVHRDIQNLHLDLIRQFHQQQEETAAMIKHLTSQIKPLIEEVQYLREENRSLKEQQYKL